MKKLLSLLLAATLVMGCLVGCGGGNNDAGNGGAGSDAE